MFEKIKLTHLNKSIRLFILPLIIFIILGINLLFYINVFSDGTQHLNQIEYIIENGEFAKEDFSGQINMNFRMQNTLNIPNIYTPISYISYSLLPLIFQNSNIILGYDMINIIFVIFIGIFSFFLFRGFLIDDSSKFIYSIFLYLNPIWLWFIVHRIQEPYFILIGFVIFYLISKNKFSTIILSGLFSAILIFAKISNIYIVIVAFIYLLLSRKFKKLFYFCISFFFFFLPFGFYMISQWGSISPTPPGIPIIDDLFFKNQWRKKNDYKEFEKVVERNVNIEEFRKKTLEQFHNVQVGPEWYIKNFNLKNLTKLIQEFIPFRIINEGPRGYHTGIDNSNLMITKFNLFIFVLGIFLYLLNLKKLKVDREIGTIVISLFVIVFILWYKFAVMRYFIFLYIFNTFLIVKLIINLFINTKMYSKFLLYTFIIIGSVSILYVESANLLEFNYSNSYKKYTLDIKMSDQYSIINDSILNKNGLIIFTPLVEAIYYIKGSYGIRDDKILLLNDKLIIKNYMCNLNIDYILLPSYSGKKDYSNWRFDDGLPKDSIVNGMVFNEEFGIDLIKDSGNLSLFKVSCY